MLLRYRVCSPFLAVYNPNKGNSFCTIPPESVIWTEEAPTRPGLIKITFGDQELFAFARDIHERTQPLDPDPTSGCG